MVWAYLSWLCSSCSFFFFKQKTAYELRISDWSSDVCSSDLVVERLPRLAPTTARGPIVTQPHDHQLAERVVEIGGIIGAARGLLAGGAFVLIALVDDHLSRLVLRPDLGVEPDRRQAAELAQPRVGSLADLQLELGSTTRWETVFASVFTAVAVCYLKK